MTQPLQQPRRKRDVLVAVGVLLVLGCAGCSAGGGTRGSTGAAGEHSQKSFQPPSVPKELVTVQAGKSFMIDSMRFQPGWRVTASSRGTSVRGLKVASNRGKDPAAEHIEVRLWNGDELLGLIDCSTAAVGQPAATMSCSRTDRAIFTYLKITVNTV